MRDCTSLKGDEAMPVAVRVDDTPGAEPKAPALCVGSCFCVLGRDVGTTGFEAGG
jgi:hypothetical protein